jgi:hypothetical protein
VLALTTIVVVVEGVPANVVEVSALTALGLDD